MCNFYLIYVITKSSHEIPKIFKNNEEGRPDLCVIPLNSDLYVNVTEILQCGQKNQNINYDTHFKRHYMRPKLSSFIEYYKIL